MTRCPIRSATHRRRLTGAGLGGCIRVGLWLIAASAPAVHAAGEDIADCIAVMQLRADDLARQVRAGDASQEPVLRTELERAAALIGRAYLDGMHGEAEAKDKLRQAQDAQAAKSEAQRAALHQECVVRADAELAAASGPQRFFVQRIAQARMHRLLEPH